MRCRQAAIETLPRASDFVQRVEAAPAPAAGAPGRLPHALLGELPGGVVLVDGRAGVIGRNRAAPPHVGLVLHHPDCDRELMGALGLPAPHETSSAARGDGFQVFALPRTRARTLCIGGSPDALKPLDAPGGRDPARESHAACGEALFRCIARNFPGGWVYAFDPAFASLLGVGSILALLGVSRSRIDGAVALRWFAPAAAAPRCVLTVGSPAPVPRRARLSVLALPDGTVATQIEL